MKAYTPSDGVSCYLVVPPSYRPQLYTGVDHIGEGNLRCFPAHTIRENKEIIELEDGSVDVVRHGEDRHDVSLEVTGASTEVMEIVEEINRRGIPVCIYPRMEGSAYMHLPLARSLNVDGNFTVTHTLTPATGTILYTPHADSGRMVYLKRLAAGELPFMHAVPTRAINQSIHCPTGRGLFVPSVAKNLLKNSNLGSVSYEAPLPEDGWRWTAGGDTWNTHAGIAASPWHDGYSYWVRGTGCYLSSPKFTLTASSSTYILFSCCYRVSGTLIVQVYDSGGSALHGAVTLTHGTGRVQWPIPIMAGATSANCTLRVKLDSGEFAQIAAPMLVTASPDSIGDYPLYLGSETDVAGEITASQLKVEGDFGMDCAPYSGNGSTWDGCICVGGYVQPGYDVAYRANKTIAFLERYLGAAAGDVELRLRPAGGFYEVALFAGGTYRAGSTISAPTRGDAFAWLLYTGRENGALRCGGFLIHLASGTEYTVSWTDGGIGYANRLYIGARSTAGYGSDSLLSAVTACSATSLANARAIARRLGNKHVSDLLRRTSGRWYELTARVSPRRYSRNSWVGSYDGMEVRAL